MDLKIKIRQALLEEDLFGILEIENSSFTTDAYNVDSFRKYGKECGELFIVAEQNKRIIGYMMTLRLKDKGDIVSIAVLPDFRNKKVGQALLEFTIDNLKNYNINQIELEVRRDNFNAIQFWEKQGFNKIGEKQNFYKDGASADVMRKAF